MSERPFLYSVERTYPVSIERLWSAWMDEQAISVWYSPTDLSVEPGTTKSEPFVGGLWTVGVSVPQYDFVAYFFGEYVNLVENELIEHTMNYTQDPAEFEARVAHPEQHLVRLEFQEVDGGCHVKFSQFGELPGGNVEATKAGMESYFDNLGLFLQR